MQYGLIWIGVIILAVIIETLTDQLISIWFVPGAVVNVVLDFLGVDLIWQILICLMVAAVGIVFAKTVLNKLSSKRIVKTNVEAIIGERCVVTERIDNFAGCGQARVNGQIWSARGVGENDVFEVGEALNVVAIEGVKLILEGINFINSPVC